MLSLGGLLVGVGSLAATVLPNLRTLKVAHAIPSAKTQDAQMASTSGGWLNMLPVWKGKSATPAPTPSPVADGTPAVSMTEVAFVNAPTGGALQMMLASGRLIATSDPAIKGTVSFSCVGNPKPFWEAISRVSGAGGSPKVRVVPVWDAYYVVPSGVEITSQLGPPRAAATQVPVPMSEARVTHRMAGYVSVMSGDNAPPIRIALLETRIPGVPPRWRMVRMGDPVTHRSAGNTRRNVLADTTGAPVVSEVTARHLILTGAGDKSLEVPLRDTGVPDVFGFAASDEAPRPFSPAPPGWMQYPFGRMTRDRNQDN